MVPGEHQVHSLQFPAAMPHTAIQTSHDVHHSVNNVQHQHQLLAWGSMKNLSPLL